MTRRAGASASAGPEHCGAPAAFSRELTAAAMAARKYSTCVPLFDTTPFTIAMVEAVVVRRFVVGETTTEMSQGWADQGAILLRAGLDRTMCSPPPANVAARLAAVVVPQITPL